MPDDDPRPRPAEIVREYGPFPDAESVNGVTFDGERVWLATGDKLQALDPETGAATRSLATRATAGTAYDGKHLFQLAAGAIQKLDPHTGALLGTIPAPEGADAGLTWAEGALWVGCHEERKILEVDPDTGRVLRTVSSPRCVTGITFVDGELWHGTWENDASELRRVAPASGALLESLAMPPGTIVTGLESDGAHLFFCGGGKSRKLRAVRRPKRA